MKEPGTDLNERVARLEVSLTYVCDAVHQIKTNELVHIDAKIDKLNEKMSALDKKVGENALKIGIVFAIFTTIGQTLVSHFIK